MTIGYIIKESGIYRSIRCAVLFSVILFLFYIIKSDIPIVNMAINNYENYWLTILVSPVTCLIIIHFFYGLSKFLIKFKVFEYASINSIGFFGYDYSTKIIGSLPVIGAYWFVFWILKVIILTLFIKVINRFNLRKYFY